jgi:hypothetical protein
MLVPELAGGDCRVADVLVDELQVPWLADAETVHRADLHVRNHLGGRHHDGLDVLVGIGAACGEPVADPQVVRAARERHRGLDRLAGRLLLLQRRPERRRVDADLQVRVFLRDRDALAVQVEAAEDVHRRRHVVLRHLAGRDQVRHRRQDMRAVDAVAFRAEHEVVARRAPRGLLHDLDVRHAVFLEDAFLLGDEQRRRVGERDEAEIGLGGLGTGRLRDVNPEREFCTDRRHQGARAGGLQKRLPADAVRCLLAHGGVVSLWFFALSLARRVSRLSQ